MRENNYTLYPTGQGPLALHFGHFPGFCYLESLEVEKQGQEEPAAEVSWFLGSRRLPPSRHPEHWVQCESDQEFYWIFHSGGRGMFIEPERGVEAYPSKTSEKGPESTGKASKSQALGTCSGVWRGRTHTRTLSSVSPALWVTQPLLVSTLTLV